MLLDTNVVVWLLLGDRDAISDRAREALEQPANSLAVSAASVWEIAIKRSLGKLVIDAAWPDELWRLDLDQLPVTARHAARVEALPWHHRDPFDRLLIAQADLDEHQLVSADSRIAAYDVDVLW